MKHIICSLFLALALAAGALAQEAGIIALEPKETTALSEAYARKLAAEKDYETTKAAVIAAHVKDMSGDRYWSFQIPSGGWDVNPFWVFSRDFKAMTTTRQ
jgi:hypothetical protein